MSATGLDIDPSPQADRAGDPMTGKDLLEPFGTLTRGRLAGVSLGGVERDGVDVTQQIFEFAGQ